MGEVDLSQRIPVQPQLQQVGVPPQVHALQTFKTQVERSFRVWLLTQVPDFLFVMPTGILLL